ncbi:MAG: transposase [Spirochaetaceae bacterium]|jgi:IS5 family transposase|nr:transposase [Spirochaetaceae bacterium]
MKTISQIIAGAQALLAVSYDLTGCFEEHLSAEYKTFLHMLRVIEEQIPTLIRPYAGTGRIPYQYTPFIRSFLAKGYFGIEKTSQLIQRLYGEPNLRLLCGFTDVPGKATFSRALAFLSEQGILEQTLEGIVSMAHKDLVVYHVSRDSTAIPAREKVVKKPEKKRPKQAKKRGRPTKNSPKVPKEPTVIEKQTKQDAQTSLEGIDKECAWGCKKNSEGNVSFWKGYKLHLDVSDTGFPLTAIVTGANVHDSQLAIPMEQVTEKKVPFCYSLMDSAYDSKTIDKYIRSRGRIPIIDPNKRKDNDRPPLDPAKQERYNIRTTVERANSHLKDSLIPRAIYVKGYKKVSFVLMTAIICLAALKYLQLFI